MRILTIALITIGVCNGFNLEKLAAQPPTMSEESLPSGFGDYFTEPHGGEFEEAEPCEWEAEEVEEGESENPWDEPLETDRHDFTQSPKVVGRGVCQLEYGVLYASKDQDGESEQTWATPELAFRYGLTDRLELRTRFNYAWKFISEAEDKQGGEDLRLSIKYQLSEFCGWRPDAALEVRSTAPTGSDELTTGRWQFGIDLIYGWEFGERFSLAGSTGANGNALGDVSFLDPEANKNDDFVAWTQSVALGAKLTSRTTGYFEWFGIYTDGRQEEKSLSFLNLGVDYLLSKNVVLDVRIGWGLTPESDDIFAGIGGGYRF